MQDWRRDSNNAIVKRFIQPVPREMYFDEVRLQMDTKLWGEEFNRHHPPKQIDFFQMAVLEFVDRPDKPLYHIENFIEGNYVKYNSNSGYVLGDDAQRHTPQAFSHFTFERSGHELMVVDIQGVGDLYTDPQIHTVSGFNLLYLTYYKYLYTVMPVSFLNRIENITCFKAYWRKVFLRSRLKQRKGVKNERKKKMNKRRQGEHAGILSVNTL
jgi:hypothetical protein